MTSPRLLAALPALALAAGCAGLFQSHEPAVAVYAIRAGAVPAAPAALDAALVVARPTARPGLEGDRIPVALPGQRFDYYAGSRFTGSVPKVVEALLVDAFRGAGGFRAVVEERSPFKGTYLLETEVLEFAADYAEGGAPVVRVRLRATLGRLAERRLIASVEGSARVPAAADRQREVAAAFSAASAAAIADLVAAVDAAALADGRAGAR